MHPLFYLPFILPTFSMLQTMTLCAPLLSPPAPSLRDTLLSDLE